MKKPKWIVEKERDKRAASAETVWLFGIHAVRDALLNHKRVKLRLIVTKNACDRLGEALDWGPLVDVAAIKDGKAPVILLLDRVTDPHNVGAILRSAEVFGAAAVIAPHRHSAPETGSLAKTASGALERQPYLRVQNLADTMERLKAMGYFIFGLDGEAAASLEATLGSHIGPTALVLGAEGPGLRDRTKDMCDALVRIDAAGGFGSLNVSNAAAVGLYAVTKR
jgi:23S rRNA (guanosine2251-2'-O)-methyltransferase